MADEEQQEQQSQENSFDAKGELEALKEQLAQMNASYQEGMQSIVNTVTSQSQQKQSNSYEEDAYLTDEEKRIKALEDQIANLKDSSVKQTQDMIRRERDLDNTVVKLATEFPEIQADANIQKAVVAEHNKLSKTLQDTAEGYELAVQRATMKAGLIPKSRRESSDDNSFSMSGKNSSKSASSKKGKTNIDEKTLKFAALLGRDIEDPKVLEGLENATKRERWTRYS